MVRYHIIHMAILIAIDDSDPARAALEQAFNESPDMEFVVLHVINPFTAIFTGDLDDYSDLDAVMDTAQERADVLLEEAETLAKEYNVEIETEVAFGKPDRLILEYAELDDIEKVVIGSHGRSGISRVLLGSVAEAVVRRSPVPVTIVR